jgi:mannose-1-phosphate guanylyltransferase
MKAVILGGGQGKRLRPLTDNLPKPLIPVLHKPIIIRQIEWLRRYGIVEFILSIGYLKEKIIELLRNGYRFRVSISYVFEDEPLGTGGGLLNTYSILAREKQFYVLNGDIITDLDPTILEKSLGEDNVGAIALVPLRSNYGIVEVDDKSRIQAFREKPNLNQYWINGGIYVLTPEVFNFLPERGDIEKTAFPVLAEKGKLRAVKYEPKVWRSIDTYKDIEETEQILSLIE